MRLRRSHLCLRANHERNWDAWRQWLGAFQEATSLGRSRVHADMLDELVVRPIREALPGNGGLEPVSALSALVHQLCGQEMERVWRYGDAHHSNILIRNGAVSGVVDWEGSEPENWAIMDWFQFTAQYLIDSHRMRWPSASADALGQMAVASLLCPSGTPLDSTAVAQTRIFLEHQGMQPSLLPALLVFFLSQFYWPGDKAALLRQAYAALTP